MQSSRRLILFVAALTAVFGSLTIAPPLFAANTEQVLYSFGVGNSDGSKPLAGLVFDKAGNLYGTTYQGGYNGAGMVFELTPGENGTWTETVVYNFCSATNCADGKFPEAGLVFDTAGNLYGTTYWGGAGTCVYVCGTVFELTPANGTWTEKVLYSFCSANACTDGGGPQASLIFDSVGNLFGTTGGGGSTAQNCGSYGCGIVFELTPGTNGTWTENVLHTFGTGNDGALPYAGLIFDNAGNLYGTTSQGGRQGCGYGCGTVFEMTPGSNGTWNEKVLYNPQLRYGGFPPSAA
jgi:uncharacterized repeat protein (TIGR03803 family)